MISFPIYLLLDVSASMAGASLEALNTSVYELFDRLAQQPALADSVRLCIISFSDEARVEMPLSDPTEARPPHLAARGATNLAPALRLLQETIGSDVRILKQGNYQVYRPVVFIVTDGYPTDNPSTWSAELKQLQGIPLHPTIVAIGIGEVDPAFLHQLAGEKGKALISTPNSTLAKTMSGLTDLVWGTAASLTSSRLSGQPVWQIPKVAAFDTPPANFFI